MDKNYNRFLHLLRCGMGEEDLCLPLFVEGDTDWEYVFRQAKKQTVVAVVFDGMRELPEELLPERMLYLKWCSMVGCIEESNERMNGVLCELLGRLEEYEIRPVLLKGQGVALRYPCPKHRMCGDIDLYVEDGDFERVQGLFEKWKVQKLECGEEKHLEYKYQGIMVELHHVINRLADPWNDRRLRDIVNGYSADGYSEVHIHERKVRTLPVELEAFYMLTHVYYHILEGGIALRQLCDWVMLIRKEREGMDVVRFASYLRIFGFGGMYGAMGHIAVRYLGLKEEMLPVALRKKDEKNGERMMKLVMEKGNFGHYEMDEFRSYRPGLRGSLENYLRACRLCVCFFRLCPREAMWFPVRKLWFYLVKQ